MRLCTAAGLLLLCAFAAGLEGSYYDLLGVQPTAAVKEIKKAYRKKSIALHPDKLVDASPDVIAQAQARFIAISKAYEVLTDAVMRRRYDHVLAQGEKEYDHQRNWDWVDQQLGIKAMHHRQPGRTEKAGMRTFTFEEAERLFNQMREEADSEPEVVPSEELPWYLAVALVVFFASIVGVPAWMLLSKRHAKHAEKEKKKAVNAENKARIAEQVQQQVQQQQKQKSDAATKIRSDKPKDVQPKKSGKVLFTRDDVVVQRARRAQGLMLSQVLADMQEVILDTNELESAVGIIRAFRDWLEELQPVNQGEDAEDEEEDEEAERGERDEGDQKPDADEEKEEPVERLATALEYADCLVQIVAVHLGKANLSDIWATHFEHSPAVTEHMAPTVLSKLRLSAMPVADELLSASVPFDDIFPDLLADLARLLCQHADDLFDEFAADHATEVFVSSVTLRDCMQCRASRVRFEPHVHMEGLHADFELWEALQALREHLEQRGEAEQPLSAFCQELLEQSGEALSRADPEVVSTLKETQVGEASAEAVLDRLEELAQRAQDDTLRSLEASYARFQRGVVLVVGEEQESKEMAKLVKEVTKLLSADKEAESGASSSGGNSGKKKKGKKQHAK